MMARKRRIEPSEANVSLVGGAQVADSSRREILKAVVVGRDRVQDSNALAAIEDRERLFAEAGAIEPPYDPESLCLLLEHSNSLRQNVDAYVTNIDGFGHRLEPAIDFEAEDVNEQIANAIYIERVARRDRGELPAGDSPEPTAEEVAARKKELMHLARVERSRLDSFFDFCCSDHSFVTLRRRTRQDLEVLGNGFWEVLRNRGGEIAKLVHVPAYTVRLLPLDEEPVEVEERIRISPVSYDTVTIHRRFRRFVQIQGMGRQVFFKEFGDPRAVSKLTGRVFGSMEELRETSADDDGPATEMIHFAVHSPRSAYGVPRWIGTLLSVLGSRQMEEVNYLYFENKSVPPLAILISGGRLSKSSIPRIEDFIENHIKGKKNFHKCLILEAETAPNPNVQHTGKSQIKIEPLTQAQMHEELFGKYDERNMDKVGGSFRLPRLLRGESKDFNRATATAALRFAEEQVFQPERDDFDFTVNRRLFSDMGIRFWRFKSNSPVTRDPERMTEMVERLVKANVLTPEEGRLLASDVFNRDFRVIKAPWVKQPVPLTLAGFSPDGGALEEAAKADLTTGDLVGAGGLMPGQGGPPIDASFGTRPDMNDEQRRQWLLDEARRLLRIRDELAAEEARIAAEKLRLARKKSESEVETIRVPANEFRSWLEPEDVRAMEDPVDE
jgi:PBSX family phage portal protein